MSVPEANVHPQEGALGLSVVLVDAGGVPAEWVEATVATGGQPTVVWFFSGGTDDLQRVRGRIGALAAATGARVLTVACGSDRDPPDAIAIERGLVAYLWLLGEGTDPDATTLRADPTDRWLSEAITASISRQGTVLAASGKPVRTPWEWGRAPSSTTSAALAQREAILDRLSAGGAPSAKTNRRAGSSAALAEMHDALSRLPWGDTDRTDPQGPPLLKLRRAAR